MKTHVGGVSGFIGIVPEAGFEFEKNLWSAMWIGAILSSQWERKRGT